MIHHKRSDTGKYLIVTNIIGTRDRRYGVSNHSPVLPPTLYNKHFDRIRAFLCDTLGLPAAQREVVLRLLRYNAYYREVFPKESQVTNMPGCSKATFWRTVARMEQLGLMQRVNRFVVREHSQISNLYRMDKLLVLLARFLAEHGAGAFVDCLRRFMDQSGADFWRWAFNGLFCEVLETARSP